MLADFRLETLADYNMQLLLGGNGCSPYWFSLLGGCLRILCVLCGLGRYLTQRPLRIRKGPQRETAFFSN